MLSKRYGIKRKNESGSVLLEVVAIITCIGLLTPLVYRQIAARMEESRNVTLAGELRTVKEAFENYIIANYDTLDTATFEGKDVCSYLDGYCTWNDEKKGWNLDDGTDNFVLHLLPENNVVAGIGQRANLWRGLVIPRNNVLPSRLNLKRAARIATLTGIDGGVWGALGDAGTINGVMGSWSLSGDAAQAVADEYEGVSDVGYVAVTSPDLLPVTQDKSAQFHTEQRTGRAGESYAFGNLNAWRHFSVANTRICIDTAQTSRIGSNLVRSDTIRVAGESGTSEGATVECDPLFWVGTIGNKKNDNFIPGTAGHVFVRNSLFVGQTSGETQAAIELRDNSTSLGKSGTIVVRASDGTAFSDGKELVIEEGQIKEGDDGYFDAAFTSRLDDIRLVSRGNAKLSEILPNYILKGVHPLDTGTVSAKSKDITTVTKPTCEPGYAPAVIITPTKWDQKSNDEGGLNFAVEIDGRPADFSDVDTLYPRDVTTNYWKITFGYKTANQGRGEFTAPTNGSWRAYAQAQTFCVYKPKETPCPPEGEPNKVVWCASTSSCVECMDSQDCISRTDGKRQCNMSSHVCERLICKTNADCTYDANKPHCIVYTGVCTACPSSTPTWDSTQKQCVALP